MSAMPELRFPEFENVALVTKELASLAAVKGLQTGPFGSQLKAAEYTDNLDGIPVVMPKDIYRGKITADTIARVPPEKSNQVMKHRLKVGDVVFPRRGDLCRIAVVEDGQESWICGTGCIRFRANEKLVDTGFLRPWVQQARIGYWLEANAVGQTMLNLNTTIIGGLPVKLPTLPEQKKIAGFLSAVDEKLAAIEAQLASWHSIKRGMVQALFTQTLRFKADDGSEFPAWETVKFSEVLFEHKLKSAGTESVYSVSVHKGLVDQIDHLGRSYSADNTGHYNRVQFGDIIYTKSPTGNFPLGIIKQSKIEKDVIVSPLYGVFTPSTIALGTILDAYFEAPEPVWNYLNPIVQKGAKNTISCTNSNFLSNKLKLPLDASEQQKIADYLSALDTKIDALSERLEATREFKRGLLQKMFV